MKPKLELIGTIVVYFGVIMILLFTIIIVFFNNELTKVESRIVLLICLTYMNFSLTLINTHNIDKILKKNEA